jgi:hypothetical protein
MWEAIRDGLARHVREESRFALDVLRSMLVATLAAFSFFLLVVATQPARGDKGTITPATVMFVSLYLMLTPTVFVYLPLGAVAGLAWPRVLAGRDRLQVVLRGSVLGLVVASAVGMPLAYGWLTKPIPAGHPAEPPRSRPPVRELVAVELSLFTPCVMGYAGWAWLASRRLDDRRAKKDPPWPEF